MKQRDVNSLAIIALAFVPVSAVAVAGLVIAFSNRFQPFAVGPLRPSGIAHREKPSRVYSTAAGPVVRKGVAVNEPSPKE